MQTVFPFRRFLLLTAAAVILLLSAVPAAAAHPTVYNGTDYRRVYDYSYFVSRYPSVSKTYGGDDKKILRYFVTTGMKRRMRGIKSFDVNSYRYGNKDLRRKYVYDYKKYYLHYIRYGYASKKRAGTFTGITKMKDPAVVYMGKNYSKEYDYFYYVKHNPDVVKEVGDDDLRILRHYVLKGKAEGRKGKAASQSSGELYDDGKLKVAITSCRITGGGSTVTVKGTAKGTSGITIGLFPQTPYITGVKGLKPSATAKSGSSVTMTIPLNRNQSGSVLQKKFYIAAKKKDGSWRVCSNFYYIENPSACAVNRTAFPKPKRGTKKGLKIVIGTDTYVKKAVDLKCSHVLVDFPIETFLSGSGLSYQYEGKTYHFSSSITAYQAQLKKLKNAGIVVTGVFYLSNRNMTQYMHPEAAAGDRSRSTIFALNTKNANRKVLEALFSCLADYFTRDGALLANWIMGNESNQYRTYNYTGSVSYNDYIKAFAEQFRLFNTAVKSRWANARTYICFDHNWNLSFELDGSYRAKSMLASFDSYLKKHGAVHYDLALHPYPSPEQDPRFWNRGRLVGETASTQQYTMLNIGVIASYVKKTYGKDVHIILPETGYSSVYGGVSMREAQAAAIAYSYYLAEFNSNIDMIGIHREKDDPGEVAGGFSLGIYGSSFSDPKPAAAVFKYMDTPSYKKYTQAYLKYIGSSSWNSLVKGFSASRFS